MTARQLAGDQRGFALLAVILVLTLMSVVVTEFAFSMRLEAAMVRAYRDAILGKNLAEAGIQQAIREILSDATIHGLDENGQLAFYTVPPGGTAATRLPALPRTHVPLGAGEFSYQMSDEEARLSVNGGSTERMQRLLTAMGIDKIARDTIVDSIEDWRDSNDTVRTNGAESEDYYLKLPVPYRARNGNLQDTAELLQIKGVSPEIYYGQDDKPGLGDLVTTRGRGTVNINTAPAPVLSALGFSDAEISDVLQARTITPYTSIPGRFTTRRLSAGSATFRIEAEGVVAGEPKARIVAIVQKIAGSGGGTPTVTVLSWRSMPPRAAAREGAAKPS
jgi:general secretion pathway protein K